MVSAIEKGVNLRCEENHGRRGKIGATKTAPARRAVKDVSIFLRVRQTLRGEMQEEDETGEQEGRYAVFTPGL